MRRRLFQWGPNGERPFLLRTGFFREPMADSRSQLKRGRLGFKPDQAWGFELTRVGEITQTILAVAFVALACALLVGLLYLTAWFLGDVIGIRITDDCLRYEHSRDGYECVEYKEER